MVSGENPDLPVGMGHETNRSSFSVAGTCNENV